MTSMNLTRRGVLAAAGYGLVGCASPYLVPRNLKDDVAPNVDVRDVRRHLPEGLTGRYFFGGGFMGGADRSPQSVVVSLDADRGVLKRGAYTYTVRRGRPLVDLGGKTATEVLKVVHRIAGRVHKIVPLPKHDQLALFPVAGAPALVDASTLGLHGSFGDRTFYADNFSAHPHYEPSEDALYYTRLDVIDNLDASVGGRPEDYVHQFIRRDMNSGLETVLMSKVQGSIVHEVGRSPDGRFGVIVFTGDGIRFPLANPTKADLFERLRRTVAASRLLIFDWATMQPVSDVATKAVPVHLAFEAPDSTGICQHVFVQTVNTTFVSSPATTYGTGAFQKIRLADGHSEVVDDFSVPRHCNVTHSMRVAGDRLFSTVAESRTLVSLNTEDLSLVNEIPFQALSKGHDQNPRGIEVSADGRFLVVSTNTSLHFYDRKKARWAGRPIGVMIGERHAHSSRM